MSCGIVSVCYVVLQLSAESLSVRRTVAVAVAVVVAVVCCSSRSHLQVFPLFFFFGIFLFFFFSICCVALRFLQLLEVGCHLNIKAKCEDDSFVCECVSVRVCECASVVPQLHSECPTHRMPALAVSANCAPCPPNPEFSRVFPPAVTLVAIAVVAWVSRSRVSGLRRLLDWLCDCD